MYIYCVCMLDSWVTTRTRNTGINLLTPIYLIVKCLYGPFATPLKHAKHLWCNNVALKTARVGKSTCDVALAITVLNSFSDLMRYKNIPYRLQIEVKCIKFVIALAARYVNGHCQQTQSPTGYRLMFVLLFLLMVSSYLVCFCYLNMQVQRKLQVPAE